MQAKKAFYIAVFLASQFLFYPTPYVHAHAMLLGSTPADGAMLSISPKEVSLKFDARIEKRVSRAVLINAQGDKLSLKPVDGGPPDTVVIPLPKLAPGNYRLQYLVLATDGHATPGIMRFTVGKARH